MWIEDLQPFDLIVPGSRRYLRSVGWLARGNPYPKGDVDAAWFSKLCALLQNPWVPFVSAGIHRCEWCRFTGGANATFEGHYQIASSSSSQLFVPGKGVLYVAPCNIAHYVDAHEYAPPQEFREAVEDCPSMKSLEYMSKLLENGGREFMRGLKSLGNSTEKE